MSDYQVTIKNKYIVVPVNMHSKWKKISFFEDGELIWDFDAHIDFTSPRFYTYVNVSHLRGKTVTLTSTPEIDMHFTFVDAIPTAGYYKEEFRPMVHFSAKIGWINDPNGLVYVDGMYHMFFQHNPADSNWGNMTWGHAISDDLVHWHELDSALQPDRLGTMFSGSGIVDRKNVTGLKKGDPDPVLVYYTAAGGNSAISAGKPHTQCMAYSLDGGMTFQKYAGNPVIGHIEGGNRDPKVVWCEELGCYILALYLDRDEYALFRSDDLVHFTESQRLHLRGDDECPDIYPLNVENEPGVRKWVFSGASDRYLIGDFKGGKFVPTQDAKPYFYGHRTSYAAQTFSDVPDRRIKIAWDVLHAPESVFENQMGIPVEVSLRKVGGEYRLRTLPVEEFETLRVNTETHRIGEQERFRRSLHRKAYDIELTAPKNSPDFAIRFFGYELRVKPSDNTLSYNDVVMPLSYTGGEIKLRIVSDVLGLEVFADDGLIYSVVGSLADFGIRYLTVEPLSGSEKPNATVTVHTLKGIW
ncbi:MAG: glycoside hydrolase family 32 protein [Clostridia bacterium]|nr:glycoside hydrolase family 32 protein [Clostridia bacterium]